MKHLNYATVRLRSIRKNWWAESEFMMASISLRS